MKKVMGLIICILVAGFIFINNTNKSQIEIAKQNAQIKQLKKENSTKKAVASTDGKERFRNSFEGNQFEILTRRFAKACLSGDITTMKKYLLNPNDKALQEPKLDLYDKTSFLILKFSKIENDKIILDYEFDTQGGEDSFTYLNLLMQKVNGEWKVKSWGLEK